MFFIIAHIIFLLIVWAAVLTSIVRKKQTAPLGIAEYLQLAALILISGMLLTHVGVEKFGWSSNESFVVWAGLSLLIIVLQMANTLLHIFFKKKGGGLIPTAVLPSALFLVSGILYEYIPLIIITALYLIFSLWSDHRKRGEA